MTFNTRDAAIDSAKFSGNEKSFDDRAAQVGRLFSSEINQSSSNHGPVELFNHMQSASKEMVANKVLPECEIGDYSTIFKVHPECDPDDYSTIFRLRPGSDPNLSAPEHAGANAREHNKEQPSANEKERAKGIGDALGSASDKERAKGIGDALGSASDKESTNGYGYGEEQASASADAHESSHEKQGPDAHESGNEKKGSDCAKPHESNDEKQAPSRSESGKDRGHHADNDEKSHNEHHSGRDHKGHHHRAAKIVLDNETTTNTMSESVVNPHLNPPPLELD